MCRRGEGREGLGEDLGELCFVVGACLEECVVVFDKDFSLLKTSNHCVFTHFAVVFASEENVCILCGSEHGFVGGEDSSEAEASVAFCFDG